MKTSGTIRSRVIVARRKACSPLWYAPCRLLLPAGYICQQIPMLNQSQLVQAMVISPSLWCEVLESAEYAGQLLRSL